MSGTSEVERQRWRSDSYRYPPYQYEFWNGVFHRDAAGVNKIPPVPLATKTTRWRPLEPYKREVRLGFAWGHTAAALPKALRESRPRESEDVRCSLLGNSFSVSIVAWFVGMLMVEEGYLEGPITMGLCWGVELSPGEPN